MQIISDGSLSAVGYKGNTVFIWDGLGAVDARKYMLEGHTSDVLDVKISPDGLKLASQDENNVSTWNRNSVSMQFEFREKFEINKAEMVFAPDGSLILAAVTEERTISIWERFGTANAVKYTLEKHMTHNVLAWFSADGMKITSLSEDNTVQIFVSAKQSPVARFELSSTHKFEDEASTLHYLADPSRREEENTTPATTECRSPEQRLSQVDSGKITSKLLLRYERHSEWLTTAEGRKLWWVPEQFREWYSRCFQLGDRIVVYGRYTAVLFIYADNAISNRTT